MRFHRKRPKAMLVPAFGLVLAAAITACSSSTTPSSGSSTSAPASSPATAASGNTAGSPGASGSSAATISAIKANWEKFFAGSTPTSERIALLQNGQKFAQAMGAMSALGSQSSAKVSSVTLKSATTATVKYTIYLAGNPMLPNISGTAINSNGKWLVSDTSLCQLLTLQNAGKAPSVCSSAS